MGYDVYYNALLTVIPQITFLSQTHFQNDFNLGSLGMVNLKPWYLTWFIDIFLTKLPCLHVIKAVTSHYCVIHNNSQSNLCLFNRLWRKL